MSRGAHAELIEFLRDQYGDGVKVVIRYTETESDLLYGESWFEDYLENTNTRSPEKMHSDAVGRLQQASLASDLYDSDVTSEIRVTDRGTGLHLFVNERVGVFAWFDPEVDLPVPAIIEDCLAHVDAEN